MSTVEPGTVVAWFVVGTPDVEPMFAVDKMFVVTSVVTRDEVTRAVESDCVVD